MLLSLTALVMLIFTNTALSYITCITRSAEDIEVTWSWNRMLTNRELVKVSQYMISWYSPREFLTKVDKNVDFREVAIDLYEDEIYRYYGLTYEHSLLDTANMFNLTSFDYVIISKMDAKLTENISHLKPSTTYNIVVRAFYEKSNDVINSEAVQYEILDQSLNCTVTTYTVESASKAVTSKITQSSLAPTSGPVNPNGDEFDTWMLFAIIPGIFFTCSTIFLFVIMLNRKWRKKLFRNKSPLHALRRKKPKHIEDEDRHQSPTSSSSSASLFRPKRNRVGIEYTSLHSHGDDQVIGKLKHWVVTSPECWQPTHTQNEFDEESSISSDSFDMLHHRHSLTTVTEESDSDSESKQRDSKTFSRQIVTRDSQLIRCKTWTPNSKISAWRQTIRQHNINNPITPKTPRNSLSRGWSRSTRNSERLDTRASTDLWWSDDESDYWVRESEDFDDVINEETKTFFESLITHTRIEDRRHNRITPMSQDYKESTPFLSYGQMTSTKQKKRVHYEIKRQAFEDDDENQKTKKSKRLGTPGIAGATKYSYQSPNKIVKANNPKKLRATKSYKNLVFI